MKQLVVAITIVLLATVGLAQAAGQSKNKEQKMSDLQTQIKEKAELAVSQFQKRAGGRLDYSEGSLAMVEEMLDEAAQYTSQMDQEEIDGLVQLMGSYILEVAHKNHGGSFYWHEQKDQPVLVVGEPSYRVAIITFDKVRSRLNGDKADNIVFFYQGFADRVRKATKGTDALYL